VHGSDLLVQHLGAGLGQPVDRVVHAELVPGHRLRGQDHGVASFDGDGRVVAVRDAGQRGHRLALAARAEDHRLVRRELLELGRPDECVVRRLQVAEVARDVQVLAHRAADHAHLAAGLDGDVHGLLHAVHVRREARDQDPPLAHRNDLAERFADEPLGAGDTGTLGVRRVAQEQVDAAVADLRQASDIGAQPVHGRVVELVVARVQHAQPAGLEQDRDRVRDRVRHPHELRAEGPDLDGAVLRHRLAELGRLQEPVLVQLRLQQAKGELRRPDLRHAHVAHQVRQRADVVLVRVREQHRAHLSGSLPQVREVRQDEIDPEMLVAREREAGVDDHDLVVELVDGQVLPDLT
jgi:hypothetical protein